MAVTDVPQQRRYSMEMAEYTARKFESWRQQVEREHSRNSQHTPPPGSSPPKKQFKASPPLRMTAMNGTSYTFHWCCCTTDKFRLFPEN